MRKGFIWIGLAILILFLLMFFWNLENNNDRNNYKAGFSEKSMRLTSSAFTEGSDIPPKYGCEGENISPPLEISEVPEGTKTLALIVYDPDVPKVLQESQGAPAEWTHWTVWNIDASTSEIGEGAVPTGATQGANGAGDNKYQGPCPPKEYDPPKHRYVFVLYALDTELETQEGVSRDEVEAAMEGHVLDKAELIGVYEKRE